MELQAAIKKKKVFADILDKPGPKEVLKQILEISVRAPSTKIPSLGNFMWLPARLWRSLSKLLRTASPVMKPSR